MTKKRRKKIARKNSQKSIWCMLISKQLSLRSFIKFHNNQSGTKEYFLQVSTNCYHYKFMKHPTGLVGDPTGPVEDPTGPVGDSIWPVGDPTGSTLLYPVSLLAGGWDWVQGGNPLYAAVKCLSDRRGQIWRILFNFFAKSTCHIHFLCGIFFGGSKNNFYPLKWAIF